ncbi:MAG: hypothetical protein GY869_21910 [Planctomycetes bacterium]|nr:hypothetical protein [Planctomycetota bacterium]
MKVNRGIHLITTHRKHLFDPSEIRQWSAPTNRSRRFSPRRAAPWTGSGAGPAAFLNRRQTGPIAGIPVWSRPWKSSSGATCPRGKRAAASPPDAEHAPVNPAPHVVRQSLFPSNPSRYAGDSRSARLDQEKNRGYHRF